MFFIIKKLYEEDMETSTNNQKVENNEVNEAE